MAYCFSFESSLFETDYILWALSWTSQKVPVFCVNCGLISSNVNCPSSNVHCISLYVTLVLWNMTWILLTVPFISWNVPPRISWNVTCIFRDTPSRGTRRDRSGELHSTHSVGFVLGKHTKMAAPKGSLQK
jgi:hypothetical protein